MPRSSQQRGFTLIELIMTLIVVGIISVPLSVLLLRHVQSTSQSNDYTMAIGLGQHEMEQVKKMPYASIASLTTTPYLGYNYTVVRTVVVVPGGSVSENLKQVTVNVSRFGSAAVLVSFVTYIAQNVLYGV